MARARRHRGAGRRRAAGAGRGAQATDAHRQRTRAHHHRAGRGPRGLLAARRRRHDPAAGLASSGTQARLGGASTGHWQAAIRRSRGVGGTGRGGTDARPRAQHACPRRARRAAREHRQARSSGPRIAASRAGVGCSGRAGPQATVAVSARHSARSACCDAVIPGRATRGPTARHMRRPSRPGRVPGPRRACSGRAAASRSFVSRGHGRRAPPRELWGSSRPGPNHAQKGPRG